MGIMLSPGVDVNELDFSDYIAQASTCVFGMVGGARKGPITPTLITSQESFIKVFGKPIIGDFGAYSALAVLGQADMLYYQRAVHLSVKAVAGTDKLTFTAVEAGTGANGIVITTAVLESVYTITITPLTGAPEVITATLADPAAANYITKAINGVSAFVTVAVATAGVVGVTYTLAGGTDGGHVGSTSSAEDIIFTTRDYDSTLNNAEVVLSDPDGFDYFTYQLVLDDVVLEQFQSMTLDPADERFIETFINKYSQFIRCQYDETVETDTVTDATYTITGGNDGSEDIEATDIISAAESGYDNTELISVDILMTPGWSDRSVISACITIAEERADCLYIFDPPYGLKAAQVVEWANATGNYSGETNAAFNSSYAAVYWPWVQINDTYSNKPIWLPPSGYVGSQIAYSDKIAEPWFAPAGLVRGRLTKPIAIEYSPNKGERDILYGNQNVVNPIVNFKGQGLTIWGQKTTQRRYTALNRVNVRRLLNYLKKVIATSTAYFVFEPNDEYSWERWYDMVEPKLTTVKSKRGVYAFKILMNKDTVTTDDIENNRMPGQIKIKPTKTAEYIPLDFMVMPTGASFEEKL